MPRLNTRPFAVIVAVDQLREEWLPFYGVQRSRKQFRF
jgi:hypothetical protein